MDYKKQTTKDGQIIIWHPYEPQGISVGLMFTPGERLQLYVHTGVYSDRKLVTTPEGLAVFQQLQSELLDFARERYPYEFAVLVTINKGVTP